MKAVILAAGRGKRLSVVRKEPKPLIPLLGLTLVERAITSLIGCGITDFVLVVGYRSDEVIRYVSTVLCDRWRGIRVEYVKNDEWDKGNGISVLKAREAVDEDDFLLLMCDHVFEPGIVEELLQYAPRTGKCVLCVDKPENVFDLEDATKLLVVNGVPERIGKHIEDYNSIDCGIFYCTPVIFDALEEAIAEGVTEWTGAVQRLIRSGKLAIQDIKGRFWCDIDTPASLKYAEKMMLRSLGKPTDGIISKHINRRFSTRLFTPLILKLYRNVTPNQVSLLSFAVAVISALLFFLYQPVIGGLFIQLSSILDGCDGEIARLKNMTTGIGGFFDAILDRYADAIILLGMFYYLKLTNMFNLSAVILTSVLAIIGSLMVSYTAARAIADLHYRHRGNRDLRLFILSIGGILSYLHPVSVFSSMVIIALMTNITVMWRTAMSLKKFRD